MPTLPVPVGKIDTLLLYLPSSIHVVAPDILFMANEGPAYE